MKNYLKKLILEKESNLAISVDFTKSEDILKFADKIGDKICILKTHIDIIDDFNEDFIDKLLDISRRKNFLIFEDRKFADIGNTVSLQFSGGIYKISRWADIVNAHSIVGEGIIKGLKKVNKKSSFILLAQMTPDGNLFTKDYAKKTLEIAKKYKDCVIGFIGSANDKETLRFLKKEGSDFMNFVPGVKIGGGSDKLMQSYNNPETVIKNGADVIIVGRGIYQSNDAKNEAEKYRKIGFDAYKKFRRH